MNPIAEEIKSYYGTSSDDALQHYGMPRRSGRYPWGSGDEPYQHSGDFLSRVEELKKTGMKEKDIASSLNLTTTELRAYCSIANNERRALLVRTAKSLKEDGISGNAAAKKMGIAESTYRSLLKESSEANMNEATITANKIKKQIEKKGFIDVGEGVEKELNTSKEKLNQALIMLEAEGYPIGIGAVPQATNPGKQTIMKVIGPQGLTSKDVQKEIYSYSGNIKTYGDYLIDEVDVGESSKRGFVYPESMDSKRIKVRLADESDGNGHVGVDRDGLIEIRRGVEDLSLGNEKYSQVRILVDGNKYLKGMAVYSDNIPDGYDIVFNSNKTSVEKAFKEVKYVDPEKTIIDRDNPFGSLIKENGGQSYYINKNGEKKLSLINKRATAGDWEDWSNALPSQFLSKQSMKMIKKQLGLAEADKIDEFNEICSLNNPTVKKAMLETFANDCDSAAVHLKAAALPRQKYHVIIPVPELKDDEVYAPNYKDGEKVALIRYPHGGTFEIPVLTVNNKHKKSESIIGSDAPDAICINAKVAARLSGADFDGDTVMVIPTKGNGRNTKVDITSTPPLKGLKGFEPSDHYSYDEIKIDENGKEHLYRNGKEFRKMRNTQMEMGKISNLITDMTLMGASDEKLARAVRHSMVVIDAEKHKLDYKQSELDNDIASLRMEYQGKKTGGAATLLSRAKSPETVLKRKGQPWINKETGEIEWERDNPVTGKHESKYVVEEYKVNKINKKTGEVITETRVRTQDSTKMAETKDANTLVSFANTSQELAYASYANKMKALANQARKEMVNTPRLKYDADANKEYSKEVSSLMAKLNTSLMNAPKERAAQYMAATTVKAKRQDNPDMKKEDIKKIGQKALLNARNSIGAKRTTIDITDREWEAIQKGAISDNKLTQIIAHVDKDKLRQRATPRSAGAITEARKNHIKALSNSGHTNAEIAEMLGLSASTVSRCIQGKE